jgi:hypothetical protein
VLADLHLLREFALVPGRAPVNPAWLNDLLSSSVQQPTSVSPFLLGEIEETMGRKEYPTTAARDLWFGLVADWQRVCEVHERARQLWAALRQPGRLQRNQAAFSSTNFWFLWEDQPWLITRHAIPDGTWFLARSVSNVTQRVQTAISQLSPPSYLAVGVEIVERALLPVSTNAVLLATDPNGGTISRDEGGFRVSVSLADAPALHARQRMRSIWFGVLILASVATVFAGFFAATRAL